MTDQRDDTPSGPGGAVPIVGFVLAETSGGIGRHVRDIAARLTERGQPAYVVAPAEVIARFGLAEVAVVTAADVGDARSFPGSRRAIRRLFRDCNVVHAHGLRAGALAARSLVPGGAPLVQTWHNAPPAAGVGQRIGQQLARGSARAATVTLAVSDDLVALARECGAADARWTPVAAPLLAEPAQSADAVRTALGATGRDLVVAVGRLSVQKGFDVLAAAADILGDETNSPLIVIAGEGPERERLSGSGVTLLGEVADIASLLAAADVVVIPSRWEGWPLVAQEALRLGCAVVATRVGGLPKLAGDAVFWVPPGDPAALAAALRRVLADERQRAQLRAVALERAAQLPDEEATMAALLAVYREVASC